MSEPKGLAAEVFRAEVGAVNEYLACTAPQPAPTAASPAVMAPRSTFDRRGWEQALMATKLPHRNAYLLGFVLAHHAGPAGYLPAGGMQHAERLGKYAHMTGKQVRLSLFNLLQAGLIQRPDIADWKASDVVRPITLTLPPTPAQTQPPHTGDLAPLV